MNDIYEKHISEMTLPELKERQLVIESNLAYNTQEYLISKRWSDYNMMLNHLDKITQESKVLTEIIELIKQLGF